MQTRALSPLLLQDCFAGVSSLFRKAEQTPELSTFGQHERGRRCSSPVNLPLDAPRRTQLSAPGRKRERKVGAARLHDGEDAEM